MGQRLNLEIVCGRKRLANCYFHWSAYSKSSAQLASEAIENYYELNDTIQDDTALAVRILEYLGGGISPDEREMVSQMPEYRNWNFQSSRDRNAGLISVTEKGMDETEYWAEGTVVLDFEEESVRFDVFFGNPIDIYRQNCAEYGDADLSSQLQKVQIDFDKIPFDEIDALVELIEANPDGVITTYEEVVEWIR